MMAGLGFERVEWPGEALRGDPDPVVDSRDFAASEQIAAGPVGVPRW
jgi:hypothetical protein